MHRTLIATAVIVLMSGPAAVANPTLASGLWQSGTVAHEGGCRRDGDQCCHAGPDRYHCHDR